MGLNILAAFILDLLIGDPRIQAHPVRLIGRLLTGLERILYPMGKKLLAGLFLTLLSIAVVFAVTVGLWYVMRFFTLPFSFNAVFVILVFFLLCNRDMVKEARAVCALLEQNRVEDARVQVARIVGRDTAHLDAPEIIRATVESVAENVVDGFTAPMFYLLLGGVPLGYAYKAVNTMDSRFGYRNERYELFGKTSARLDDLLNFIPARLNGLFLYFAAGFNNDVMRAMLRHGRRHSSPNSGIAEAGFAGCLGMALGGPASYGNVLKPKPWIGENKMDEYALADPRLIRRAVSLYWRVVGVTLAVFTAACYFLNLPLVFSLQA
jgi:adenosylcobinamide-phosphate synthase